jgi:putative GTP pyrophosphokinase
MASLDFAKEKEAFKEFYAGNLAVFRDAADSICTLITLLLADKDEFPTPQVIARVKDRNECIAKFVRKYQADCEKEKTPYEIKDYITDLIGLRIICLYSSDVEPVRRVLEQNFDILDITDKSQIVEMEEGLFGYKGLHLDLKLSENRRELPEYGRFCNFRFEVQLRTIIQDAWSVLDHKIKYKKNIPHELKRRINRLAALFELADQEFLNIREETKHREATAKAKAADFQAPTTDAQQQWTTLDAFSFLSLAQRQFPDYPFQGHKVDSFVAELLEIAPNVTPVEIEEALAKSAETLEEYKRYQEEHYSNRLNPYTTIRHALYHSNPAYSSLLFDLQRTNFDDWQQANAAEQANPADRPSADS